MPVEVVGINLGSVDLAVASKTTEVSVTATTSATGNTCISTGAFFVPNAGNYYVECFVPYLTIGTTNLDVELFEGASSSGTFLQTLTGHMTASAALGDCNILIAKVNLTSGSHNMTVTAFVDAGTGKFGAGTGATGQPPPAYLRVRSA